MRYFLISLYYFVVALLATYISMIFVLPSSAASDMFHLEEVSLNYKVFSQGGRDPLISYNGLENKAPDRGVNLILNTTIYDYFYWKNRIHSMTDIDIINGSSQFRTVGWEFNFGIKLCDQIQFGYYHHSSHLLDTTYKYGSFPVLDGLELKIIFINKPNRESLF